MESSWKNKEDAGRALEDPKVQRLLFQGRDLTRAGVLE